MTNGLFSLFSSLIANTPPYRKGLSSRRFLSLFLILFFAVGNAWAASSVIPSTPDYKDIFSVATDGTYTFTCSSSNITSAANAESSWIGWYSTQSSFKEYNKSDSKNCMGVQTSIPNLKYDKIYFYIQNCSSFEIQGWANGDNRTISYSYQATDVESPTDGVFTVANKKACGTSGEIELNASKKYIIVVWNGSEEIGVTYMVFNSSAPATTYTVTYNANGGSGEMAKTTNEIVASTFTAPNGKMFKEWNTAADGNGTSYAVGADVTKDITLFAIWQDIQNFDVKFYPGYGENTQIGETQSVILDGKAEKPADPTREGYRFVGWSTDGTEANIKTIEDYAIIEATTFTAVWKQVYTVTFDGSNEVKVDAGTKVASIASPTQAGKKFAGWYNGENKWDFSANVEGNMSLVSKWTEVDPNHFVYAYNDDFHYDGDVYKAPDGKVDNNDNQSNKAIATPYTLFEGTEGITSVIVKNGIYDSKGNHVNAFLKLNTNSESNLVFTIKEGYVATLKMKMGSWDVNSAQPNLTFKDASDNTYNFEGEMSGNASGNNYAELTYNLTAGTYTLTTATKTLYISNIDLTTTALAAHQVTYNANGGVGEDVVVTDATLIAECSFTYAGKKFIGWNTAVDGTGTSYEVGAVVDATLKLYAQWVDVYTASFNLQGHGAAIEDVQVNAGGTLTKPTDPTAIGWEFGGWYTNAECTNAWEFTTVLTENITLYAQWTAFDGCVVLAPATTSGTTPASKANVELQTGSYGGKIIFAGAKDNNWAASFAYTENGFALQKGGADSIRVQLDYQMKVGTKLTFVVYTADDDKERGFYLKNSSNETKSTFAAKLIGETIYTYTVVEGDGLAGNSVFILGRNQTAYLKSIKVTNCGGKIVSVNYAISPAEAVDKATVTLSANKSVEGQTITATYSSIASGWDFDKWEVNGGATMDDAQANPVTITMGAENPTVTLVLKPGAIKHTVSFDAQGGSAVESQLVEENGKPILPAEPTKEDYIFKGWAEAADGAAVDVTSFAITAPKTFYAIWESDGAIKLLNGATVNHTNFITGVTAEKVTIGEVEYDCVKFGGTVSGVNGVKDLTRVIAYNATTNQTKIKLSLYNTSTSSRTVQVKGLVEGADAAVDLAAIELGNKEQKASDWIEFNNEANRTIYIFISSSAGDVRFLQVKVIESGATTLKKAGEAGYSLNFNKGRFFGLAKKAIAFEGLNTTISSDYQPLNSSYARFNATNMNFTTASPVLLRLTTNNNKTYYVTNTAEGTDNVTEKTGVSEFNLTAGTWYINAAASEVQFTKIEFLAPKCDAPVFNALSSSDICSGESYVALDGTATITDGGTVTYKWYAEGGTEVLAETATYTPKADGSYYVVATNSLAGYTDNVVQSEVVTVTTHSSAAITTAPENVRMDAGETATLAVVATGKAPLTYQWYTCEADGNNAMEIVGAAAASYEVTVGTGVQYYKVVVSSDCGTPVEAVVKVEEWTELPLADVTSAITWDFSKAVTAETTLPSGDAEIVLANVAGVALNGEFESNKLKVAGTRLRTTYIQAKKLMFHATIPGKVTIEFSNTGNKDYDRILYVNGVETTAKSKNQDHVTYSIVVPAGDVVIQAWEKAAQPEDETWNLLNIYSLSFSMADYIRTGLTVGSLGTICLPSNVPAGYSFGATFYKLVGKEPQYGKIVFDEILSSSELEAGKPYLFQAQSDVLYCFYGTESVSDPDNSGAMKGTFVDMTLTDLTNIYYFAQKALWSCVDLSSLSVPANRAYVKMDEMPAITESNPAPGVRRITLGVNGQQVATGVDQVQGDEAPTKMIINGQLFILRGEKMYDAQGKLVK